MRKNISMIALLISITISSNIFAHDTSNAINSITQEEIKNKKQEESSSIGDKLKSAAHNIAGAATQAAKNVVSGTKSAAKKTKIFAKNALQKTKSVGKTIAKKVKKTIHSTAEKVKSATEETPKQEKLDSATILSWIETDKILASSIMNATIAAGQEGFVYFCSEKNVDEIVKDKKLAKKEVVVGIPNQLWKTNQNSYATVATHVISFDILNDITRSEKSIVKKTFLSQ